MSMRGVLPANVDDPRFTAEPVQPAWLERALEPLAESEPPEVSWWLVALLEAVPALIRPP